MGTIMMVCIIILVVAYCLVERHQMTQYEIWRQDFNDKFLYHPEIQPDEQRLLQMYYDGLTTVQACNVIEGELTIETKTDAFESGNVIRMHKTKPVKKESVKIKQFPITISKHDSEDMLRYDPVLMSAARLKELKLKEDGVEVWERKENMIICELGYFFAFFESELKSEKV